jgi:hypothetical protein
MVLWDDDDATRGSHWQLQYCVATVPPADSCAREDSIAVRLSFITYTSWGVAAVMDLPGLAWLY